MTNLSQRYEIKSNVLLKNRLVMAPMTTKGSTWDGYITDEDINFYQRRADTAGLLITGATAISPLGENFPYQMSIYNDSFIPGMAKLAKTMKSKGNKAIVQLYHSGANSITSYKKLGKAVAPSRRDFYHLPYVPSELTEEEILGVIDEYGLATQRVIDAGFDGVEIHGAYGHIIQQFFSKYSNKRTDTWGGTLNNRMKFITEIIKKVKDVVSKNNKNNFIIGFRISEVEYHENEIGYELQETLKLINLISNLGIDYIHGTDFRFSEAFKKVIDGRTTYICVPNAIQKESIANGLQHGDLVSMARASMIEPDYATKLENNSLINTEITSSEMAKQLMWPNKLIIWMLGPYGQHFFIKGLEHFKNIVRY
jgi:2,4-dienoyl-CoA reductase-like NADH-dependent reductase (Old Yellow Enzyme family)